jgi:hypothetical protein
MRLHNASLPPGRTRELCLDFFAAVATLNSLREGARINARATPWFLTSFQTSSSGLFPASTSGERTIGSGLSPGARSNAPTCPCALDILSSKTALLLGYKLGTRVAVGSGPTRGVGGVHDNLLFIPPRRRSSSHRRCCRRPYISRTSGKGTMDAYVSRRQQAAAMRGCDRALAPAPPS